MNQPTIVKTITIENEMESISLTRSLALRITEEGLIRSRLTLFPNLSEPIFGWLDQDAERRRYDAAKMERQQGADSVELEQLCTEPQTDPTDFDNDFESFTSSEFNIIVEELQINVPAAVRRQKRRKLLKKILSKFCVLR